MVAATVAAAGCGIGAERAAERVPADEVPFGLLAEPMPPATATRGVRVDVFLVADDLLVSVERLLPPGSGLPEIVDALSAGPTEAERSLGLSSSLPAGQVNDVASARGVALVDLRPSFAELPQRDQAMAIAQMVFSLTGQPGIGRVAFTLGGGAVDVPRGDGALTTDAVARDDFEALVADGADRIATDPETTK